MDDDSDASQSHYYNDMSCIVYYTSSFRLMGAGPAQPLLLLSVSELKWLPAFKMCMGSPLLTTPFQMSYIPICFFTIQTDFSAGSFNQRLAYSGDSVNQLTPIHLFDSESVPRSASHFTDQGLSWQLDQVISSHSNNANIAMSPLRSPFGSPSQSPLGNTFMLQDGVFVMTKKFWLPHQHGWNVQSNLLCAPKN